MVSELPTSIVVDTTVANFQRGGDDGFEKSIGITILTILLHVGNSSTIQRFAAEQVTNMTFVHLAL
jgi:hypothetical protein